MPQRSLGSEDIGPHRMQPVIRRMAQLGAWPLDVVRRIDALGERCERINAKATLQTEDDEVGRPRYIVSGWACRQRYLSDGRRQVFGFLLPGDGVGVCLHPKPLANATTWALTPLDVVDAQDLVRSQTLQDCPGLTSLLVAAANEDERLLLNHVVRLGRLDAMERVAHLFLELHDRLAVVGIGGDGRFPLPLTQELLADALGLSVVHINRTLQELRRQKLIAMQNGHVTLLDRPALVGLADYTPRGERQDFASE